MPHLMTPKTLAFCTIMPSLLEPEGRGSGPTNQVCEPPFRFCLRLFPWASRVSGRNAPRRQQERVAAGHEPSPVEEM